MEDTRGQIKAQMASGDLQAYVEGHAKSPHPYLQNIRENCQQHKWNFMLTTPDQVAFLYCQALLIGARKILELGCYYGHSTLALAAALPSDGLLISVEHNPKFASIARNHLEAAGVGNRVEIKVGEAPIVLQEIEQHHTPESFDMIFVDADKRHFDFYWEAGLKLLRKNGLMVFDNALARGEILNSSPEAAGHIASVRDFNAKVLTDQRVYSFIATLADGMLVTIKK
jgi:predicted O-methyltransferase YrrM